MKCFRQLIPLNRLYTADLLQIDAHYAKLSNGLLKQCSPDTHNFDAVRAALAGGQVYYCTDTPSLQLILHHEGKYYINPAASAMAGKAVINALKQRFPQLNPAEKAPYQITASPNGLGHSHQLSAAEY